MLFWAASVSSNAQNLVPNGGFELPQHDLGNRWEQPDGQYMHYEQDPAFAASGQQYNGICMYSSQPNEYFRVPLMDRMAAGETYRLSMKVRVWGGKYINFQALDSLEILFTQARIDVTVPFYCFEVPTMKVPLAVTGPNQWVELKADYLANGDERYLMIGNFFSPPKELPPIEYEAGKKRKGRKANEDFRKAVGERVQAGIPKVDSANFFKTRWYFDDVCLALVDDDGSSTCFLDERPKEGEVFLVKDIRFETDQAELLESSFTELERWVQRLNSHLELRIRIVGHTDNVGNATRNQALSDARALDVKDFLVKKGIQAERLEYEGLGSANPIAENSTETGRAANRRVEFLILE